MFIRSFIAVIALVVVTNSALAADRPITSRVLGGEAVDLLNSPVALIVTDSYLCTGTLVGPKTVITAAHCIAAPREQYRVYLGGQEFVVAESYYNKAFSFTKTEVTLSSIREDIGALVLAGDPPAIEPIPIRAGLAVAPLEHAVVQGYGASEAIYDPEQSIFELARTADVTIEDVDGTLLATTHPYSGASTCAGDSGGPILQRIGETGKFVVIGVVSAGTNKLDALGRCREAFDGFSLFVDLQGPSASEFLQTFDVNYVSGASLVVFNAVTDRIVANRGIRAKRAIPRAAKQSARALISVRYLATADRKPLIRRAIRIFNNASKYSGNRAVRSFANGNRALETIRALGL